MGVRTGEGEEAVWGVCCGRAGKRDRQAGTFLDWMCETPGIFTVSQIPGLSKAYTCFFLCTMAQTLVFLVLFMNILGRPQRGSSYSYPQAAA